MKNRTKNVAILLAVAAAAAGGLPDGLRAQDQMTGMGSDPEHTLPLTWDRWLDHEEIGERMELMADTWPEFLSMSTIGDSYGGRELWLMTMNNPDTGPAEGKAAMWIEANIHGNEIQGAEVSLYTIWYMMENYDRNPEIRRMVDERVFYFLPSVNPDGRDYFLHGAGSGARTGHVPVDSDGDGLFDEDPANDLNGNGVIEQIRKYVPGRGTHRLDPADDRFLIPVAPGETGDWIQLGSEGIDDDGDGRVNEDPVGGYDTNRNWGSDWQPEYIQGGAMNYPFEVPESRAINDFMVEHPHIAGLQSYHNTGGMILRGPGAAWFGEYPTDDVRVYDELGEQGERMLPYYNYYVVWQGLYSTHGGSIDWQNDGLGIVSFVNELWNGGQYFNSPLLQEQQRDPDSPISGQQSRYFFDDFLEFGDQFVDWAPFDHPTYGEVEMGGWKKLSGRVNPRFMSMELFHRNMAFTLWHADQLPLMSMGEAEVERVQGDVWRVRVPITNERLIPTITVRARENAVVRPDLITVDGGVDIITAGWVQNVHVPGPIDAIDQPELDRIMVRSGHPGRTTRVLEYLVRGSGSFTVEYDSVKGGTVRTTVQLR
ncbi:M14 family metallopeptidase [Gaopeijia maritima]|uniref:M14 family metallopeptidase n=1 Tax=Gaopeijia maritima TaxID=3119007 RepID=A0ABU9ECJ9_9BACT